MTHYKTITHAERAVEASTVKQWSWGGLDRGVVIRKLIVWLFLQDIKLTHEAVERFVTEELGQDTRNYNLRKGN